jgi:predicted Zn-dependent protease
LLSEFGRNARLFRQTETEADLMGAYLLRNAGWDPRIAVTFWREQGGKVDGGLFRSRTHPSSKARAEAIERAIATIPADAPMPYLPPLLEQRDAPLDGARGSTP